MIEVFISFFVGYGVAVVMRFIQGVLNKTDPTINVKSNDNDKSEKHYLINNPVFPIIAKELEIFLGDITRDKIRDKYLLKKR